MGKLRPLLWAPNTGRGNKASHGSSLPFGKLALTMPTDILSSGLLRTTDLAWTIKPRTLQGRLFSSSILLFFNCTPGLYGTVLSSPFSATLPLQNTDNLWADHSLSQECLLPAGCLNPSSLQMEAQRIQGTFCFIRGYLGIDSQVYSLPYPTQPSEVFQQDRL